MVKAVRLVSVVLLGLMILASGCGSPSTNKPAKTDPGKSSTVTTPKDSTAQAPKETIKVSMAVGGKDSIIYLPPAIAEYAGFFKEEAIDVTVQDLKGGAQAAQALTSGQVDFASMALDQAVKAKAQGVDLVMLDLYTRYPAITLVVDSRLKDKVKSVSDLKGMKVGVTSVGSATHQAMLSLMDKFGLKTTDIEIIGVGTSDMPAALTSGKVQAAFGLDPWVTQVVSTAAANVLWDLRTKKDTEALYGSEYPFVGLVTRREVLQKNPEMVSRVVRAVVRGNKFLTSNAPDAIAAKLPAQAKGSDAALYLASLKANLEAFSPDGQASSTGIQLVINSLKKDKTVPESMDIKPEMVFDGSYARQVK